jgi:hypothetical protein
VISAPASSRRRTRPAAAGEHPPRRPRAGGRAAPRVLRLAGIAALAVAVAACSGAGPSASAPVGRVFTTRQQVSLAQVRTALDALYRAHPGISSFAVQDVTYTAATRDTVLAHCAAPPAAGASQAAASSQLIACAPLIYFLYRYGRQAGVPAAVTAAGQLYWYAVTHVAGPASARAGLDELLHSWKLPVPGLTPAQAQAALEASVVQAADAAITAQKSVHVVITGATAGAAAAERIVADIGTATGTESIASGTATATIRVARREAYFTGSPAGLTTFIGLPAAAARKAAGRWVALRSGTREYQDLAAEDTIAALPASLLPGSGDAPRLRTTTMSGAKVYVLSWQATPSGSASGSASKISERLILAATSQPLPISETTSAGADRQTVTLRRWGEPVRVPRPASAVPYAGVTG